MDCRRVGESATACHEGKLRLPKGGLYIDFVDISVGKDRTLRARCQSLEGFREAAYWCGNGKRTSASKLSEEHVERTEERGKSEKTTRAKGKGKPKWEKEALSRKRRSFVGQLSRLGHI